nr:helix-turn-helix transcriptional regulator [Limosilactobacillus mucosae]
MNRLLETRKSQGKTLAEVSKETGVSEMMLSRYERGKSEPKIKTWQKIADYFGVSVPYLQGFGECKTVTNRIRDLREKKGLSQSALGKQIGVSQQSINNYENGRREPKLKTCQKLADYFGVSVQYLLGLDSDTNQTKGELDLALAQATKKYSLSGRQVQELKQELLANLWFQAKWIKKKECEKHDTTDFQ